MSQQPYDGTQQPQDPQGPHDPPGYPAQYEPQYGPSGSQPPQFSAQQGGGYQGGGYQGGGFRHPAEGSANAALWCGIVGLLCCPLIPSVIALVLARHATNAGYPGSKATVAAVLGWIGLVLTAIGAVAAVVDPALLNR